MKKLLYLIALISMRMGVNAQDIKCENVIIGDDTITVKIYTYQYPSTAIQFQKILDQLRDEIKFKDDTWDVYRFWEHVLIVNSLNHYRDYEQGAAKIISQMNDWLDNEYGKYALNSITKED